MQNTRIPTARDFARQSTSRAERDNMLARLCGGAARGDFALSDDQTQVVTRDGRLVTLSGNNGLAITDVVQPMVRGSSYVDAAFIASEVAPLTPVKSPLGIWYSQNAADAVKYAAPVPTTPGGRIAEIPPTLRTTNFATTQTGLAFRIAKQLQRAADLDVEALGAVRLGMALGLDREQRVSALVMASATYPAANVAATSGIWSGGTPKVLVDLYARYTASPLELTTLVISEAVEPFFYNTAIQTFMQAGGRMPRVIVGRARVLIPNAGSGLQYVWGSLTAANAALVAAPTNPKATSSFRTFTWSPPGIPSERVVDGISFYSANLQDGGTAGEIFQTATYSEQVLAVGASDGVAGLITGVA